MAYFRGWWLEDLHLTRCASKVGSPIPFRFKAPIDGIADGREKDILIHVCDYMNDLATGHVRQMTLMVYT